MSSDDDLEILDKLLEEASRDPVVAAVQERTKDSGHVDPELLEQFREGGLAGDELTNVRRHLLFCDECTKLAVGHGGEIEEEQDKAAAARSRRPPPARGRPRFLPLVLLAMTGIAAITVLALIEPPVAPRPELRGATLHSIVRGPLADMTVQPEERIAVSLDVANATRLFCYVLAMTPDDAWHCLEPTLASPVETDFSRTVWLPHDAEPDAAQRASWRLGDLARARPADHVGLYVFISEERIPFLEGDELSRATLPRFEIDFAADAGRHDRAHVEEVGARLEAMGLADIVVTLAVRIEPL